MPFIGTTPAQGFVSSVNKQSFTANGSTTSFTLTHPVSNANDLEVFVGNVRQEPTAAYSASGTTLDFGSGNAPPSGVNLYVIYKNLAQVTTTVADGSVGNAKITAMAASKLSGALPALDGSALTGRGMKFISKSSPGSDVAQLDLTLSAANHDFYKIVGFLDNTSDNVNLRARFFDSSGSIDSGSGVYHIARVKINTSQNSNYGVNSASYMDLSPTIGHNGTAEDGFGFEMTIGPTNHNNFPVQLMGQSFLHDEGGNAELSIFGAGYIAKAKTFGGIRFYFTSGNIGSTSELYVYGMNKS